MKSSVLGALACMAALSGCASIVNGVSRPFTIETGSNGEPLAVSAPVAIDRGPATSRGMVAGVEASVPPAMPRASAGGRREFRYLVAAESFGKKESCAVRPVATFVSAGPGYETYAVSCKPEESTTVRCDFGICRAVR